MKKIVSTKLLSSKKSKLYNVRKEELTYDDGSKEIRVGCYTFEGKYLGGFDAAQRYLDNLKKPVQPKKVR